MLYFYLRRALRSLRRTPALSSIMVIDMALGLAIWVLSYAAISSHSRDPLGEQSRVFHVDWGTSPETDVSGLEGYQRVLAMAPHVLLSYRDAQQLSAHPAIARKALTFSARLSVATKAGLEETQVRFCTHELFSLFELEFEYGQAWGAAAERAVVLDHATNLRLFGGGNSVGKTLPIDGRPFRVAGVLAKAPERVLGFDFTFWTVPSLYLPFSQFAPLGARPDYLAHRAAHGPSMSDLTSSDDAFVQLWVELPTEARRAEYAAFLLAAAAKRAPELGAKRAMLAPSTSWLAQNVAVPNGFYMFEVCAFLALLACSVNLSRLLIVKFQARAPELALQRALGATRNSVFAQHMLEVVLVTLAATALALLIARLGLLGINRIVPDRPAEFTLDATGIAIGCALGLGFGLLAGVPAAYRMCQNAPATFLRLQ